MYQVYAWIIAGQVTILTILTMELNMYAGNNTSQFRFNAMGQVGRVMGSGQNECFNDANIFFLTNRCYFETYA